MTHCIQGASLTEFFRDLVRTSVRQLRKEIPDSVEFYLVHLLETHCTNEHLTEQNDTLALLFARAVESGPRERAALLKQLGDRSLYTAGFFPASLSHKSVGIKYYVQMGATAYGTLSQMPVTGGLSSIFEHLAERFVDNMDILSDVSSRSSLKTDLDLLRLYELWLETGSERIHQLLAEEGILPVKAVSSNLQ